jgi:SSS family solute:Na+ symporter
MKGLALAALTAAIVAGLAGKANSIATIFTLDIYKKYIGKSASEAKMVWIGKITIVVSIAVAVLFTWNDTLGIGGAGGFTFIQKYTGFISPGVFAMFLLGMFWKRTTGAAAITGLITGFGLSVFFNEFATKVFGPETWIYTAYLNKSGLYEIPFQICMGLAFAFTLALMIIVSLFGPKENPKAFELDKKMFKVEPSVMVLIVITLLLVTAIYVRFW